MTTAEMDGWQWTYQSYKQPRNGAARIAPLCRGGGKDAEVIHGKSDQRQEMIDDFRIK